MGSACCVAAKERTLPTRVGLEDLQRNSICSPSCSFRWYNRGHVAGEIEDAFCHTSSRLGGSVTMDSKCSLVCERGNLSEWGSFLENAVVPISHKSPGHGALLSNPMTPYPDVSTTSNCSILVKNSTESSEMTVPPAPDLSVSSPSAFSTPNTDHLSSYNRNCCQLPNSTPSRWTHRSPGHPLLRQISDSRVLGLKSPDNSISEGRPSFVFSACSNDIATGSQGASSDGWSLQTFSELVASSQRERWSFDSEYLSSSRGKISGCSSRFSYSPTMDLQSCGVCSKLLTERSWNSQKFVAGADTSVVAVMVCGHVYHAECLETLTAETDRYDPGCPVCIIGEKQVSKLSKKASRAESESKMKSYKMLKNRVVDSYLDRSFKAACRHKELKWKRKAPNIETSSSCRGSFGKPFLKRHFSLRSKWSRSVTENDSSRKNGFWARYLKD